MSSVVSHRGRYAFKTASSLSTDRQAQDNVYFFYFTEHFGEHGTQQRLKLISFTIEYNRRIPFSQHNDLCILR